MAGRWRTRESVDVGEVGVVGALLPALGRIGVQGLGVCPENNGITFKVGMYWHVEGGGQGCC